MGTICTLAGRLLLVAARRLDEGSSVGGDPSDASRCRRDPCIDSPYGQRPTKWPAGIVRQSKRHLPAGHPGLPLRAFRL